MRAKTGFAAPLRDGVSASRVQVTAGDWPSALAFLCHRFASIDESMWRSRFARGLVLDESGVALNVDAACRVGEILYYYRELQQEAVIPFAEKILYQDDHILVADKPHFLPVIPSGRFVQQTLLVRLKKSTGIDALSPIHRIDKDTAGLVLFSKNPATRDAYQSLFRTRSVHKTYHAIAPLLSEQAWPLCYRSLLVEDEKFFCTQEVAGEPNSETLIDVLQEKNGLALYRLQPVTGRKHQLRVQMAALGAPILNDPLYPAVQSVADNHFSQPLQLLAQAIAFIDPLTGVPQLFSSKQQLLLEQFQLRS